MVILKQLAQEVMKQKIKFKDVNTSSLIHEFITNLCMQSNPDEGLKFSREYYDMMNKIKKFNYEKIYSNSRFKPFMKYADLIINTIFDFLYGYYFGFETIEKLKKYSKFYPTLTIDFSDWLIKYSNIDERLHYLRKYRNKIIYDIANEMDYKQAIIDYISGMSDNYAIKAYKELIEF
jgi:dGTPase